MKPDSTDEAQMLARIAHRLGRQASDESHRTWNPAPSLPERTPVLPVETLAARFLVELVRLGGRGLRAQTEAEAVDYVLSVMTGAEARAALGAGPHAAGPVLLWDDPLLSRLGLASALSAHGLEVAVWNPEAGPEALKALAAQAPFGITSAAWGVAETGSIALPAGSGQGRLVSLLPPTHIALLPEERLLPSLAELFRTLARENRGTDGRGGRALPSSLALTTGPSRSADIENDLSIGVHGPAEVHVVLLPAV